MQPEEFLALPTPREQVPLVTQVRTTLIASSIRALQTRGDFDRYLTHLAPEHKEAVTMAVAGTWLPLAAATAHYTACDHLGYGQTEFAEMGRDVGNRIHGTILATTVRLAKNAGMTPWSILAQFRRLWERIFVGGALGVTKVGPKEAHVECVACPLVGIPYYRHAQRVLFLALLEMFCEKAYASDVRGTTTSTRTTYRFAWA